MSVFFFDSHATFQDVSKTLSTDNTYTLFSTNSIFQFVLVLKKIYFICLHCSDREEYIVECTRPSGQVPLSSLLLHYDVF